MFPPGVSAAVNICLTCLWSHVCRTYPHAGRTRPHACRTYPHLQVTNMYIEVLHWVRSHHPYWWVGVGWGGVGPVWWVRSHHPYWWVPSAHPPTNQ